MITYSEYRKAADIVAQYKKEQALTAELTLSQLSSNRYISVRLYHILRQFGYGNYTKLKSMNGINYNELRRFRNCGEKTITEIKDIFNRVGLEFDYT